MQGYAMAFVLDEPKNELASGPVKSEMARHTLLRRGLWSIFLRQYRRSTGNMYLLQPQKYITDIERLRFPLNDSPVFVAEVTSLVQFNRRAHCLQLEDTTKRNADGSDVR